MIVANNLFRNKIRSLMTVLGVAVGVSIFVSLTSINNGFKNQLYGTFWIIIINITIQRPDTTPIAAATPGLL